MRGHPSSMVLLWGDTHPQWYYTHLQGYSYEGTPILNGTLMRGHPSSMILYPSTGGTLMSEKLWLSSWVRNYGCHPDNTNWWHLNVASVDGWVDTCFICSVQVSLTIIDRISVIIYQANFGLILKYMCRFCLKICMKNPGIITFVVYDLMGDIEKFIRCRAHYDCGQQCHLNNFKCSIGHSHKYITQVVFV